MRGEGWASKHFRVHEFACPCCGRYIKNDRLLDALEELREELGGRPIFVTSGVRCPERNEIVGGAPRSQHLSGRAADIVVRGKHPFEVAEAAEKIAAFRNGGIGTYPNNGFVHVDVRPGGPARWRG